MVPAQAGRAGDRARPVISEWEIWACAHELIRQHGEDAAIQAAMKADDLLARGALDGAATWRLIVHRINALERGVTGTIQ